MTNDSFMENDAPESFLISFRALQNLTVPYMRNITETTKKQDVTKALAARCALVVLRFATADLLTLV